MNMLGEGRERKGRERKRRRNGSEQRNGKEG